ncbi:conserved hypothetical protein [Trichinella spiralis]|uniref:hypothetical protein n=1 Tax=Trichinella spiralis TaxID=6334 RepID=UPI0001EFE259|nr:conserved hypothetical protein [Trichinella spiralis]
MFHSRPVTRSVVMESCGESLQHHQWIYSHVFDSFSRIQNYINVICIEFEML